MPVYVDHANAERDSRINALRALPLPFFQKSARESVEEDEHKFDVVVIGAGPAGLMLTLLLSRYGITDDRLLCIDSKDGAVKAGQADGLQPRTIEVFKSLGLADEILNEACQMWEVAFWNPGPHGITRTSVVPDIGARARYAQEFTIHQGRIERILKDDLARYSARGIQYKSSITSIELDESTNKIHPIVVTYDLLDSEGQKISRTVRAKHVVGCDGAHSLVRRSFDMELRGDTKDHIWGVIDLVVDSDFPDMRRRCAIHSDSGSVMIIPRERLPSGDYLTRLYVQVGDEVDGKDRTESLREDLNDLSEAELNARERARQKRARVSLPKLMDQARAALWPYVLNIKEGTSVDWWAAYQIGQRMADKFSVKDSAGIARVFIAGDACHTHSPKAGQGMNVSMMDSYNLAWKLAYHLQGITSKTSLLLDSYEHERRKIAAQLIDFDHQFSSMFSGQIGVANGQSGMTSEEFEAIFSKINGFTTGCGIEYAPSKLLVWDDHDPSLIEGDAYLDGILKPGRRLLNVRLVRHADSCPYDIQDDFPSAGRFGILMLVSTDLLEPTGRSVESINQIDCLMEDFCSNLLSLSVVHKVADQIRGILWQRLPAALKKRAEMRFHSARPGELPAGQDDITRFGAEDAYSIYGIRPEEGALIVVRPDGYVGLVATLEDVSRIKRYLSGYM